MPEPGPNLDITDFEGLGESWDRLATASGNIFSTREWLRTWFDHYGGDEPLVIAGHDPDGRLATILPLEVRRIAGVRVLRFLGDGPSDQMGPLSGSEDGGTAVAAMRKLLREPPRRYQLFVGRHLPAEHDWATLLDSRRVRTEPSPVLWFEGSNWDAVLTSFGAGLRKEIRYAARRLAREHDVRYRICDDPATLSSDLDVLFGLHAAQWGGSSSFTRHESFHRAFAAIALERGWLRLWTLDVDGRPRAVKLNFRFGSAEFSYQGGRDPSWRGPSLGLVNLANAMHTAFEEGAREYRFLRGGERYKFRFPVQETAVQTVVKGRGAVGHVALAAGLGLDRFQPVRTTARRVIGRRLSG